uniref:F-box/kelch-repeat protein At3g27150 n=1 Tax=Anthurium amnicola TaxID=1678845 RepID=A0A1D1XSB3_9ARAE
MSKDDDKAEASEGSGGSRKGVAAVGSYGGSIHRRKIRALQDEGRHAISLNRIWIGIPSDRLRPQDADYSYLPSLSDELALLILARLPRSEYPRLCLVNRRYHALLRSDELYTIRREIGVREPCSVFMLASGEPHWWSYDPRSGARRNLPILPSDVCFSSSDKETLCAGTHLLVSGKETGGAVIWRYELPLDKWFKGPPMISSRSLFASANCGSVAYVAGGIGANLEVLNSAEKYNSYDMTWDPLPRMKQRRKLCSGCYMDGRFYVIAGQNEEGENLTCGEYYDPERDAWEPVPDMMKVAPSWSSQSPPLVAVVNNELYSLEASSNQLKVYLKRSNSWKDLGEAPVRADHSRGWGVAFKSLGDELLLIGSKTDNYTGRGMTICTCTPDPNLDTLNWRVLQSDGRHWSSFVFNCSIMMAR